MAIIVSPTMPPGPHAFGDEWHHTISGLKFRWTQNSVGSGVWVQFIPSGEAPIPFDAPIITNPTPRSTQSAFAPAIADPGDFWYHSETGVEFIYYDDGNTRQWVTCQPTKVGDIIVVTGPAGGDLTGSYPNPLIKPDVELTGVPTLETSPATADDSKKIASTEFVRDAIATFSPPPDLTPYATIVYVDAQDALKANITYVDAQDALKANLASPTFTGDPKAPTPATADNDTSIATTAFVRAALATFAPPPTWDSVTGKPATFPPTLPIAQSGVTNLTTDLAAKAPLASPALTGNPTAPTPTTSDNDTSIATTAFVKAAMALGAPVTVSATPPASPYDGQLWFSSELLILFVRYNDGTSTQWVSTSGSGTSTAIPPGTVVDYMGGTVPSGWYLCDGTLKNRTTDALLFEAIGITFGPGDGSTTFALPDCRGRVLAMLDGGSGRLTQLANTLGAVGGDQRTEAHTHGSGTLQTADHLHGAGSLFAASHTHGILRGAGVPGTTTPRGTFGDGTAASVSGATEASGNLGMGGSTGAADRALTVSGATSTAGAGAAQNVQPTMVVNKLIKR